MQRIEKHAYVRTRRYVRTQLFGLFSHNLAKVYTLVRTYAVFSLLYTFMGGPKDCRIFYFITQQDLNTLGFSDFIDCGRITHFSAYVRTRRYVRTQLFG